MRVIAAVRLSKLTDNTTSVESQTENLQEYAERNGHTIVALTEDLDVSGGKPIKDRPGIGPWLKEDKLDQWDGLLFYTIDRAFRNHRDFVNTWYGTFEPNGKKMIAVYEDIDMTTDWGERSAIDRVLSAQSELRRISERNGRKAKQLIMAGYINGGIASRRWGYKQVKSGKHYILTRDNELVDEIREIVQLFVEGNISIRQLAPKAGCKPDTLGLRLRSVSLKGCMTYKGEIIRDEDGLPILLDGGPIIGETMWDRLQEKLAANARGARVPKNSTPWLGVIFCAQCGQPMYRSKYSNARTRGAAWYVYYRHLRDDTLPPECRSNLSGTRLESQIDPLIRRGFRGVYLPEFVRLAAINHKDELAKIEEGMAAVEKKIVDTNGDGLEMLLRTFSALAEKAARLRAEERPAHTSVKYTDELLISRWDSLATDHERGDLLRKLNIRLMAKPTGNSDCHLYAQTSEKDWHEQLEILRAQGPLAGDQE